MFASLVRASGASDDDFVLAVVGVICGDALASRNALDQVLSSVSGAASNWVLESAVLGLVSAPCERGLRRKWARLRVVSGVLKLSAVSAYDLTNGIEAETTAIDAAALSQNRVAVVATSEAIVVGQADWAAWGLHFEVREDYPTAVASSCWGVVGGLGYPILPRVKLGNGDGYSNNAQLTQITATYSVGRDGTQQVYTPLVDVLVNGLSTNVNTGVVGYMRGVWLSAAANSGSLVVSDSGEVFTALKRVSPSVVTFLVKRG